MQCGIPGRTSQNFRENSRETTWRLDSGGVHSSCSYPKLDAPPTQLHTLPPGIIQTHVGPSGMGRPSLFGAETAFHPVPPIRGFFGIITAEEAG
jgi:hypothetical protein